MAATRDTTGVIAQLTRNQHRNTRTASASPRLPGQWNANNSTITSFLPDHESTRQYDTAADAPSILSNGSDSNSQANSEETNDRSIEMGRGLKKNIRNASARPMFEQDYSEEQLLSLGDNSLYDLTATPPMKSIYGNKNNADLRRQASIRRAALERDADVTKTSDIVPAKTRGGKPSGRRTLSDMHAKVNAMSDSSFVLPDFDNHNHGHASRNSRFAKARATSAHADIPTRFVAGAGLGTTSMETPRRSTCAADASLIGNQTAQSFMLPDLPNIAELVSGVRKDGTPVFSRTTKPKSRFASASYARGANADVTSHAHIQSLALPDEEKAIFTSLQLLKEKVDRLEMEKSEALERAEKNESEMIALRSQVQMERRLRRPDSGFGSDEERQGSDQWRIERGQLQASLKTAQDRLESVKSKHSSHDIAVKRITQERDSLITQLGVAFYSNEELKEESTRLREEVEILEDQKATLQDELGHANEVNRDLREQLVQSEQRHDSDLRQWAVREAELKARYKHRSGRHEGKETVIAAEAKESRPQRRRKSSQVERQDAQSRILERVEQEVRKARAEAVRQSKVVSSKSREASRSKSRSRSRGALDGTRSQITAGVSKAANVHQRWLDEISDAASTDEMVINTHEGAEDDSKDVTYLSFLDPAELAALRRKLEAERQTRKQRSAKETDESQPTVTQKSSMKDIIAGLNLTNNKTKDYTTNTRNVRVQSPGTADHISYSSPLDGDDIDISTLSTASRRPVPRSEEMTSAFILPDITMHSKTQPKPSNLTASVPGVEDLSTLTIRPSQPPTQALASVLSQLQAEIAELKKELGKVEKEYESHDPEMGQRRRVSLKEGMERLVGLIERKSEMVYRLVDVREGQKGQVEQRFEEGSVDLGDGIVY